MLASAHAPQTPRPATLPQAQPRAGESLAPPVQNLPERDLGTVGVTGECPGCASAQGRVLFRGSDRLYRTTSGKFAVVECENCRLLRLEPRPDPAALSHYYPGNYWFSPSQDAASALEESYRRLVLRDHVNFAVAALRNAGPGGPVLDVGCGGGLFLRLLRERGFTVLGLDNSAQAAEVAQRQNGVEVVVGDLTTFPFEPGSFSGVTMFHVVEHLLEPLAYLEAAARLLTPDGRLIVQVPNAACWQLKLFGERWNGLDMPRHLINYRQADIENLLDYAGFAVVRRKHFSLRDNPAGFATSLAPRLDPMARRVRGVNESVPSKLLKDAAYFGLTAAALPFTLLEAACGAGSTIMLEARKKN